MALDFVDWFSSRGEAFEHNAASIERHMNAIAGGNVAATRSSSRAASGVTSGSGRGRGGPLSPAGSMMPGGGSPAVHGTRAPAVGMDVGKGGRGVAGDARSRRGGTSGAGV